MRSLRGRRLQSADVEDTPTKTNPFHISVEDTPPTEKRTKGLSTGRQTFLKGGKGFKTLIIPKIKRKYSSRIEGRRKKREQVEIKELL